MREILNLPLKTKKVPKFFKKFQAPSEHVYLHGTVTQRQSRFPVIHKVDSVDNFVQSSSNENTLEVVN